MFGKAKFITLNWSVGLVLTLAGAQEAEAQARRVDHTVSVRVPSVVRLVADPNLAGPDGLPVYRVVTNDPVLRRRLEEERGGVVTAERLAAAVDAGAEQASSVRFTVAVP